MIIRNCNISDILKKNAKALLVNPPIYDYLSHTHSDSMGKWSQPTALLRLAAFLNQKNCKVSFIDCMEEDFNKVLPIAFRKYVKFGNLLESQYHIGMSLKEFENKLKKLSFYPDQVFISSIMTYWWESVKDTIKIVKRVFSNTEVILGGIYTSLIPEHAKKYTGADIIIQGRVKEIKDFCTDLSLYETPPVYAIIFSSRGCPWNCAYCAQRKINQFNLHCREPEDVVSEIEEKNKKFGIKEFIFFDDNLLTNKKHFQMIMELIISKKLQIILDAPKGVEPDLLDLKTLQLMKNAGWRRINLALETIDNKSKSDWNRIHSSRVQFQYAITLCKEAGFNPSQIYAFILYGMPAEDIRYVEETADFVNKQEVFITPMPFTPVPGSELYTKYQTYINEKKIDLEDLHERLFPFAEFNGYNVSSYIELEHKMFSLNLQLSNLLKKKFEKKSRLVNGCRQFSTSMLASP